MFYSISLTTLPLIPELKYAKIILSRVDGVGGGGWVDYVKIMLISVQLLAEAEACTEFGNIEKNVSFVP